MFLYNKMVSHCIILKRLFMLFCEVKLILFYTNNLTLFMHAQLQFFFKSHNDFTRYASKLPNFKIQLAFHQTLLSDVGLG